MPRQLTPDDFRQTIRMLSLKTPYSFSNRESAMFECWKHKDWNPSFSINFKLGICHCFQCGYHGTINQLCKDITHKNIYQLLHIEDNYSDIYYEPPESSEDRDKRIKVLRDFSEEYRVVNPIDIRGRLIPYYNSERALEYLKRRGISREVADRLEVHYAPEVYMNGTRFIDRVIIPIYNEEKKWINAEGRAVNKEDPTKCLYPKNSTKPIFEWYSLDKEQPLYLFEGIIKMAVGRGDPFFKNSSATLGAKVSDYQAVQLNLFEEVILVRDSDEAGIQQAKRIKEFFTGKYSVWTLNSMEVKDCDEIPTHLNITVQEFRESGGFIPDVNFI
jgi:DNA primase